MRDLFRTVNTGGETFVLLVKRTGDKTCSDPYRDHGGVTRPRGGGPLLTSLKVSLPQVGTRRGLALVGCGCGSRVVFLNPRVSGNPDSARTEKDEEVGAVRDTTPHSVYRGVSSRKRVRIPLRRTDTVPGSSCGVHGPE